MPARPLARAFPERGFGRVLQRTMLQLPQEILMELPRSLVTPGWLGLEAMSDDRCGAGRNGRVAAAQVRDSTAVRTHLPQYGPHRAVRLGERMTPGQQFIQDDPEAVEVAPLVSGVGPVLECLQLLGGQIGQRPSDAGRRGAVIQLGIFGW